MGASARSPDAIKLLALVSAKLERGLLLPLHLLDVPRDLARQIGKVLVCLGYFQRGPALLGVRGRLGFLSGFLGPISV